MNTEQNKAIVRRYFEEVLNQHHLTIIDELFAPYFKSYLAETNVAHAVDLATYIEAIKRTHTAFPDLQTTIQAQIAEGDLVATRWKFHGTHHGMLGNLSPTGKEIVVTAMHFHRIEQGKIVEHWEEFDLPGFMQQLGVFPEGDVFSD